MRIPEGNSSDFDKHCDTSNPVIYKEVYFIVLKMVFRNHPGCMVSGKNPLRKFRIVS
jgi:hypothetical protein